MSTDLDRVLDPDFLGDLQARPIDEVRAMRSDCQEIETGLSYLRRLVQARLDIIDSELGRRTDGGDPNDLSELIGKLPEILADRGRTPGVGRLPQYMAPADNEEALVDDLDSIVDTRALSSLPEMDESEVRRLREELEAFEHGVSAKRRALHERIDALQAEITRRYRTGEASVETLLH